MGISETILAATIGAAATLATALFQLFSSARSKTDSRGSGRSLFRTALSIAALMAASAVGGYFYAEVRADTTRRDLQQMRDEFSAQLKAVASTTARIESLQTTRVAATSMPSAQLIATVAPMKEVESVVHVPPCVGDADADTSAGEGAPIATPACELADAQKLSLCAALPTGAIIQDVQVFSRPDNATPDWNVHRVGFDQDSDGARFIDKPYEQNIGAESKALCVNYAHFNSERAHLARLVVQYRS
jgi:hypothetical protein